MTKPIHKRDDTDPDDGERKYGDVEFADPVNNKYPIDWSYINKQRNAAKYNAEELDRIRGRIRTAARRYDIEISDQD